MNARTSIATLGLSLILAACGGAKDDPAKGKDGKDMASKSAKADADKAKADGGADEAKAPEVPALDPKVEQAVTLANQISAKPEDADAILEAAGMDREAFERLLYEIARDPELSRSYAVARDA